MSSHYMDDLDVPTKSEGLDIRQILHLLLRRYLLILIIFSGCVSAALVAALSQEPSYKSSMTLLIRSSLFEGIRNGNLPGDKESELTDSNLRVDYTAQIKAMESSKLIGRAVELLQADYPNISIKDIKETGSLEVEQLFQTGSGPNKLPSEVFEIRYTDKNPEKTQKVLQSLQKVYSDYNIEQQKQRLEKGLAFINQQLPKVRQDVVNAEFQLQLFRESNNLIEPEQQAEKLLDALNNVQELRREVDAQLKATNATYLAIQNALERSPKQALTAARLSESSRYQVLLDEIQQTELELEQARTRYEEIHPEIKKLLDQRSRQINLLQQEINRILSSTSSDLNLQVDDSSLLSKGQLGDIDLSLVQQLTEAQTILLSLTARNESLAQSEQSIKEELAAYPSLATEYNRLSPEVDLQRETLAQLVEAQQSLALKIAQGGFDWQILEEPELGDDLGTGRLFTLVAGTVVGLALGIAVALIVDILDDRIHSLDELRKLTSVPILGVIPKIAARRQLHSANKLLLPFRKGSDELGSAQVLGLLQPEAKTSPLRQAFDLAYYNLESLKNLGNLTSLMVTSALPEEGASTISLGLAISAAGFNKKVLIIDANFQQPGLHHTLKISNQQGLSQILSADDSFPQDYIQALQPQIDILTAGPVFESVSKVLNTQKMEKMMRNLEKEYDLVLLDAPPLFNAVESLMLADCCSGIILVSRLQKLSKAYFKQTLGFRKAPKLVGVVVNEG